jgi:hydrogenase maturation protease
VLVAGIGNIFHGDDAFGVAVAQKILAEELELKAKVVDFGIRGIDLVFALMDGYDFVVLVDAVSRGGAPGTIYVIEPDLAGLDRPEGPSTMDGHSLDPWQVLRQAAQLGARFGKIVVVGCEPASIEAEEGHIGLTAAVEAAIDPAISHIRELVSNFLNDSLIAKECVA